MLRVARDRGDLNDAVHGAAARNRPQRLSELIIQNPLGHPRLIGGMPEPHERNTLAAAVVPEFRPNYSAFYERSRGVA